MRLYITNKELDTTKELITDIANELNEQFDCDELDELTKKFDEMKEVWSIKRNKEWMGI